MCQKIVSCLYLVNYTHFGTFPNNRFFLYLLNYQHFNLKKYIFFKKPVFSFYLLSYQHFGKNINNL